MLFFLSNDFIICNNFYVFIALESVYVKYGLKDTSPAVIAKMIDASFRRPLLKSLAPTVQFKISIIEAKLFLSEFGVGCFDRRTSTIDNTLKNALKNIIHSTIPVKVIESPVQKAAFTRHISAYFKKFEQCISKLLQNNFFPIQAFLGDQMINKVRRFQSEKESKLKKAMAGIQKVMKKTSFAHGASEKVFNTYVYY